VESQRLNTDKDSRLGQIWHICGYERGNELAKMQGFILIIMWMILKYSFCRADSCLYLVFDELDANEKG